MKRNSLVLFVAFCLTGIGIANAQPRSQNPNYQNPKPPAAPRWKSVADCATDALTQTEVTKSYIAAKDAYVKALAGVNMGLPQSASALDGVARAVKAVKADPNMTMQKCTDYNDSIVGQRNAWADVVARAGRIGQAQGKNSATCAKGKQLVYCLDPLVQSALLKLTGYDAGTVSAPINKALMIVAYWGNAGLTKALLDAGGDANFVDTDGSTPLLIAAFNAGPATGPGAGTPTGNGANYIDTVKLLVARGANPKYTMKNGKGASELAALALKQSTNLFPTNKPLLANLDIMVNYLVAAFNGKIK